MTDQKSNAEIIEEALNLLGPNGEHWGKKEYFDDKSNTYCTMGAVQVAAVWGPGNTLGKIENAILTEIDKRSGAMMHSVEQWNDKVDRTFDEVHDLLMTVAKKFRDEGN